MADDVFVYEFLFRGGASSKPDDNTWHVILAREVVDINGNKKLEETPPLSPSAAAGLGFPLSRILSEVNQTALDVADEARKSQKAAEDERDALLEQVAATSVSPAEEAAPERSLLSKLTLNLLK